MTQDDKNMGKFKSSLIMLYGHMCLCLVPTFDPFPTGEEGDAQIENNVTPLDPSKVASEFGSSNMCFVACLVKLSAEHISKCVGRGLTTYKIIQTISSLTEARRPLLDPAIHEEFTSFKDLGNGSSSGGHECVWLLMMSEGDGELVLCIWREFMGRDLFENGMNLDK
ncbi:hypothetical protein Tco_0465265 [Tanacetum coccineum]